MNDATTCEMKMTIGLDVGDRHIQMCVLADDGETIEEGRITCRPQALIARFGGMPAARIVLEAGTHSPWISRILAELGHEVIVANPRRLRLIYENDSKSDRVDAQYLARLGRLDPALLSPLAHRDEQTQADLAVIRSRDALVRARTSLINHVRGSVKAVGGRIPGCSTRSFAKTATGRLPEELAPALGPILDSIADLTETIRAYDRAIERLCREVYPETAAIAQPSGIGNLTALAYVLTIGDPARFRRARSVGSYLGLRPRKAQSGKTDPQLRITKAGDEMMRRLLVGSAQYILGPFGPDTDLKRWGLAIAERGGKTAKRRATVAVARKLSVLLLRLWTTGEVCEPLRNSGGVDAVSA